MFSDPRENLFTNTDYYNINGGLFFLLGAIVNPQIFRVVGEFPRTKYIIRREYFSGMYKLIGAYMSSVLVGIPMMIVIYLQYS